MELGLPAGEGTINPQIIEARWWHLVRGQVEAIITVSVQVKMAARGPDPQVVRKRINRILCHSTQNKWATTRPQLSLYNQKKPRMYELEAGVVASIVIITVSRHMAIFIYF